MGKLWKRLGFLLRRKQFADELDEEMRFHLDLKAGEGIEAGLPEEEARYRALRRFGNTARIQERSREVWIIAALAALAQDLRYAVRILRKSPGFAAMTILGLGLGIGLGTTVFTILNAALLTPREGMKDPATYVSLAKSNNEPFSYSDYIYLRDHNTVLSALSAWRSGRLQLIWSGQSSGEPQEIDGRLVSANSFSAYGENFTLGRGFLPEEDQTPGSHPVAILSSALWQNRFGGDPGAIGKTLILNGEMFTVVGVAPRGFSNFIGGDVFLPLMMRSRVEPGSDFLRDANVRWLGLDGRLKSDISIERAEAELTALMNGLREARSEKGPRVTAILTPGGGNPTKRRQLMITALSILLAVGMILLIACANTANLLLARAAARRREIGVRLSLGASRGRVIRQLLTESLLLAMAGGAVGMLLSMWLTHSFIAFFDEPFGLDASLDWRVLAYCLLTSIGTGVAFGLAPAFEASRPDLTFALKAQGVPKRPNSLWSPRNSLVVAPLAVSLMLLAGAGLVLQFLRKSNLRNSSLDIDSMIGMALKLDLQGYDEVRATLFHQQLSKRLEEIPGVGSVALTHDFPLAQEDVTQYPVAVEGDGAPADSGPQRVVVNFVSANYFATIGMPVVRGRGFTPDDSSGASEVAIINESMARRFWPDEEPLGKRLRLANRPSYAQVIGVVKDASDYDRRFAPSRLVYVPSGQARLYRQTTRLKFLIRCKVGPEALRKTVLPAVRGETMALDNKLRVLIGPLSEVADSALRPIRIAATLSSALGSLAMLLAAVGIYGVMAYAVAQRTQEIGIRIALGAQKGAVLRLVLGRSVALIGIGVSVGLAGTMALSRVLAGFLAGLGGMDTATFAAASAILTAVATVASYLPARRATAVDPMVALRYE